MISNALIVAILARMALVEAAPAKASTVSFPEVITIHPPGTTKTTRIMTWPDGFLNLPGQTSTITETISLLPVHARDTGGVSPAQTQTATVSLEEGLSPLPVPTEDDGSSRIFIPIEAALSADASSSATQHSEAIAFPTEHFMEARAPQPEKTVFITITKGSVMPTSKAKPTQSTWSKGKHCPYPYPGENCRPPKSERKTTITTKSSSTMPRKTPSSTKPCPYPGQKC